MSMKILLFCLLLITSCHKDNPVLPSGEDNKPVENKWVSVANTNTARAFFCSAEIGQKIYLIGGANSSSLLDEVEEYDLLTNKCVIKHKIPEEICGQAAAEVGGKIYVFGGRTENFYSGKTLNYTYMYDPDIDSWTRKNDMPSSRAYLTASAVDGKIYTIGGCEDGYEGCTIVQMYDPASDTWIDKTSLPTETGFPTSNVLDGKIYVIGGGTSYSSTSMGTSYPYFLVYDPVNDAWNSKSNIEPSRVLHGSNFIKNKLYVCGGLSSYIQGGVNHYTLLNDLKEYDLNADTWTTRASMPAHRRAFQTCVYNNRLYVLGGFNGDPLGPHEALQSVIEYIPPSASN